MSSVNGWLNSVMVGSGEHLISSKREAGVSWQTFFIATAQ